MKAPIEKLTKEDNTQGTFMRCNYCGLVFRWPFFQDPVDKNNCPRCDVEDRNIDRIKARDVDLQRVFAHSTACPFGHAAEGSDRTGDCKQRNPKKPTTKCSGKCDCDIFAETYAKEIEAFEEEGWE